VKTIADDRLTGRVSTSVDWTVRTGHLIELNQIPVSKNNRNFIIMTTQYSRSDFCARQHICYVSKR